MAFYEWTAAELGLHVPEMDKEHQELIRRMNKLYNAAQTKTESSQIQTLIDELATYTIQHFKDEETYMTTINFPGLETHKIIHQQLLKQFNEYIEGFKKNHTLEPAFFNFLKVWLTGHIRGIDMKYSDFIKPKGKKTA